MKPDAPISSHSSLPISTWQSDDPIRLVELIDRHIASVREVVFVQPRQLHLPNTLRRATEALGPCSFRIDFSSLDPHLIDEIGTVARMHPLEVWFRISTDSRLARSLRTSYPQEAGRPDIHEEYLEDLEIVGEQLEPGDLWVAIPGDSTCVVVLGRETVLPETPPPGLSSDDVSAVQSEIEELHRFFVDWFKGAVPNSDATFSRFELAMAPDFELTEPGGKLISCEALAEGLRQAHGRSADTDLEIWIENMRLRSLESELVIATYEEWQRREGETTTRQSSAVFRLNAPNTPGGVEWRHVHETWLKRS